MATFENCEIFSNYCFSYVRGYKAALRGGNKLFLSACCRNIPNSILSLWHTPSIFWARVHFRKCGSNKKLWFSSFLLLITQRYQSYNIIPFFGDLTFNIFHKSITWFTKIEFLLYLCIFNAASVFLLKTLITRGTFCRLNLSG